MTREQVQIEREVTQTKTETEEVILCNNCVEEIEDRNGAVFCYQEQTPNAFYDEIHFCADCLEELGIQAHDKKDWTDMLHKRVQRLILKPVSYHEEDKDENNDPFGDFEKLMKIQSISIGGTLGSLIFDFVMTVLDSASILSMGDHGLGAVALMCMMHFVLYLCIRF
jgi:hypothetical protein